MKVKISLIIEVPETIPYTEIGKWIEQQISFSERIENSEHHSLLLWEKI